MLSSVRGFVINESVSGFDLGFYIQICRYIDSLPWRGGIPIVVRELTLTEVEILRVPGNQRQSGSTKCK